ncbi:hypothetical protein IFM51744_09089 [Aspergillus udagawae]|nr:hypothetical protein IFM51744_09089 [Aspergillus udagawae]
MITPAVTLFIFCSRAEDLKLFKELDNADRSTSERRTWPDSASNEAVTLTVASGVPQEDSIGAARGRFGLSGSREQRSPAGPGDLGLAPENAQSAMPRLDFIRELHRILDEPSNEEAMRWSGDGRSFVLTDKNKFPLGLLACLSVVSYSSLIRRLYY